MYPALKSGQYIVCSTGHPLETGMIIVARKDDKEIIKRLIRSQHNQIWLEGDNALQSTDSRQFGWIDKSDILGVMKYTLPIAQKPRKVRVSYAPILGWAATFILTLFSLIHLFRIDTFVPELAIVFGGNQAVTLWVASFVVTMQVFALPFLMRMTLSQLAQYVSGAFAIIVPLFWLLIALWTYGTTQSTAQLGEFVDLPSSLLLIFANAVWLAFSFYTIWALGYDKRADAQHTFVDKVLGRLSK